MVNASRDFIKDGNKNRLRDQDIHRIVDVFTRQTEVLGYSRMVPLAEIASNANDYNLNLPRYIDSSEPEDLHDIRAHLQGGIPNRDIDALGRYWDVFPSLRDALFADSTQAGYRTARIAASEVKATILSHAEFRAYTDVGSRCPERLVQSAEAPPDGTRHVDGAQISHQNVIGRPIEPICGHSDPQSLRHLPALDGLLGRDHAGRRIPRRG